MLRGSRVWGARVSIGCRGCREPGLGVSGFGGTRVYKGLGYQGLGVPGFGGTRVSTGWGYQGLGVQGFGVLPPKAQKLLRKACSKLEEAPKPLPESS